MTTSPNPDWKPGDKINSPVNEMIKLDLGSLEVREAYRLLIDSIVPRPIAFLSSINLKGEVNLAPFSYFNGVSTKPPCIMVSFARNRKGEKKDSLINIEETGEFVVNSANEWLLEPLVYTAGAFPYGVNEMEKVGLTPLASELVKSPRVKESAIQMECKVHKSIEIGDGGAGASTIIFGEIVLMHVSKEAYSDGSISFDKIKCVGRLGGASYGQITNPFDVPRPKDEN